MSASVAWAYAAGVAVKNAAATAPFVLVSGALIGVTELTELVGPRGIAVFFAVLGAGWRWHRFRLTGNEGLSGLTLSMTLAFILGDGQVPFVGPLIASIKPDAVPMMNGFFLGLFGLLVVSMVQDFIKAYAKKAESK
jgi:hypothetical protein